jgi:hypothetical protein
MFLGIQIEYFIKACVKMRYLLSVAITIWEGCLASIVTADTLVGRPLQLACSMPYSGRLNEAEREDVFEILLWLRE